MRFGGNIGKQPWLNIILAATTSAAAIIVFSSVYLPPHIFFPAGMLSLLVPVMNMACLGVAGLLLFRRSRWGLLPLATVLAAMPVFSSSFSFVDRQRSDDTAISVLTYNVSKLSDSVDGVAYRDSFRSWVVQQGFDIVCLQELEELDSTPYELDGYHGVFSGKNIGEGLHLGIKVFSKKPVIRTGHRDFQTKSFNRLVWADIAFDTDTIRLITVHLKSYNFLYYSPGRVYSQMRSALMARSWHTELTKRFVAESPYPVVLCGDFNETPYGNAYRRLTDVLTDTFEGSGAFHEYTYWFVGIPFRIDHIFAGREFEPAGYRVHHDAWWSDHSPVSARLVLK